MAYVGVAFRRPSIILGFFVILATIASWFAANQLRVVTDLGALLPEGTPSVQALDESKTRIGSTAFFVIAIESKSNDADGIADAQDELMGRIQVEWSDAEWVQVARDTSFFRDRALYYFDETKLNELKDIIDEEVIKASAESMPGMVDLLKDDDENSKDDKESLDARIEGWLDADTVKRLGMPPQIHDLLSRVFDTSEPSKQRGTHAHEDIESRLIGPEGDVGVVLVQLTKPARDLDYARFALTRGEDLIEDIPSLKNGGDLRAQVVGAYRSFREVDAVANDGMVATIISVTLILVLILVFFGSPRAVLAVFMPLWVAGAITMALTAAVYGRLTALTIFVLAMLAGMGIDYGIHLFGRITAEMHAGLTARKATENSLADSGQAVFVAAATSSNTSSAEST